MTVEEINNEPVPEFNLSREGLILSLQANQHSVDFWVRLLNKDYLWWYPKEDRNHSEEFIKANINFFQKRFDKIKKKLI